MISDLSNESYRFDASIMSETGLDRKLLAEFYDPKILKRIKDRYDEFWKNNCESFNNAKWRKLLKKYNLSFSKITSNKSFEIQRTLSAIPVIEDIQERREKDLLVLNYDLEQLNERIQQLADDQIRLNKTNEQIKTTLMKKMDKGIEDQIDLIKRLEIDRELAVEEWEDGKERIQKLRIQIDIQEQKLNDCMVADDLNSIDLDSLKDDSTKSKLIQYQDLMANFEKIPSYNYGKKNRIKREIDQLEKELAETIAIKTSKNKQELETKIQKLNQALESALDNESVLERMIEENDEQKEKELKKIERIKLEKDRFRADDSNIETLMDVLDTTQFEKCNSYYKNKAEIVEIGKLIKEDERIHKPKLLKDIMAVKGHILDDSDKTLLEAVKEQIKVFTMPQLLNEAYLEVRKEIFNKYKVKGQSKYKYRFDEFLTLYVASLFYPSLKNGDLYLNIDEAQDISLLEYNLLKSIVDNKCVFNLYGDVNQLIYDYKGIEDWEEISFIKSNSVWVLNENYRNTIQITEYCNDEFYSEIIPIGLEGPRIKSCTLTDGIDRLLSELNVEKEKRIAILCHSP